MVAWVTGAAVLSFVGVKTPGADETEWATLVADAVSQGIDIKLNGAALINAPEAYPELRTAALIGGAEAYKRREATFGLTGYADLEGAAIRVARDYLAGIAPLIERYNAGPGIG